MPQQGFTNISPIGRRYGFDLPSILAEMQSLEQELADGFVEIARLLAEQQDHGEGVDRDGYRSQGVRDLRNRTRKHRVLVEEMRRPGFPKHDADGERDRGHRGLLSRI
ncbi:MAG: hypothetical protein A3B37_02820 [Candidatus Sungbacteria bacterium RIFCSPLOWO2_01_FULL_59_16]|uniref:Uncharacterized protein n=1 Tax=Candidatus Sungbacteria bacterium RIFCSPLOWO2_01_FULL_59_16 TaxID=1802280 RepID=A0A1G2L9G6_9BACT|nr:MAG: hypothetical protein A3B37_02820 [Candidatus Sungbacteria bacterium RIFCSPLOWO2_01_FULL_59_16]